jgi:hypothetical protein
MDIIIAKNDAGELIKAIAQHCESKGPIGGIHIVDANSEEVALVVDESRITERDAKLIWSGWKIGLSSSQDVSSQ